MKLYNPYLKDKNLLMGHYIKLAQDAYEDKKISKKENGKFTERCIL